MIDYTKHTITREGIKNDLLILTMITWGNLYG